MDGWKTIVSLWDGLVSRAMFASGGVVWDSWEFLHIGGLVMEVSPQNAWNIPALGVGVVVCN